MTLEQEYALSFYREIAAINSTHQIYLVQHIETQQLFVKKMLTYYHLDVMIHLRDFPIAGVPRIHELIEADNSLTVIEDYIHGETLEHLLARRKTLSETESIDLIRQLCTILHPLHASVPPIVHRDIKPSNLILSQDGTLYLIDFNAAKLSCESASRDTELIGTHGYAAPEQYGFAPSGPATDIYAIGVLLNVMLTGELPFVRTAGGVLGMIVKTCTAMEPSRRYSSVDHLRFALTNTEKYTIPISSTNPKAKKEFTQRTSNSSWLPPGFRTRRWWKMLLASGYYLLIFLFSSIQEVTDSQGNPIQGFGLLCNRIICFLFLALPVFVMANYRNLYHWLPLQNRPFLRWIVRILVALLSAVIPVVILLILESLHVK
ncbi:MAG: serine/threonine-protein kinase [Eubacteriales bacterium]|nr:serine/threonine-protein kinase [Eubacteriales bacterium]